MAEKIFLSIDGDGAYEMKYYDYIHIYYKKYQF